jgi:hypothetical protein
MAKRNTEAIERQAERLPSLSATFTDELTRLVGAGRATSNLINKGYENSKRKAQ